MLWTKVLHFISLVLTLLISFTVSSSTPIDPEAMAKVKKTDVTTEEERRQLQTAAGLLAEYEIEAKKLIDSLEQGADSKSLSAKASSLLALSETVIESARFRLPQCEQYLAKTLEVKSQINDISHEALEEGYHQDGALPKAGGECYHTKDLFIHPATVIVLTRDDPALSETTKDSIRAEIDEVLAHTELVRQLVIY